MRRKLWNLAMKALVRLSATITFLLSFLFLAYVLFRGLPYLNWQLIVLPPATWKTGSASSPTS